MVTEERARGSPVASDPAPEVVRAEEAVDGELASGPALAAELDELKAAQQLLGEIQDLHVLEGAVRKIAAQRALDRSTVRALQAGAVQLEAAGRERHAQFVKHVPRLDALATDLTRKTPLEWIRRRPARMSGLKPRARAATVSR